MTQYTTELQTWCEANGYSASFDYKRCKDVELASKHTLEQIKAGITNPLGEITITKVC